MTAANTEPVDISDAVLLEQESFEAEREQEEAAFDGESEPDVPADPEPAPEPQPAPATDVAAEAAARELDKLGDRYTKAVQKVNERAELGLVECPVCPVPGFVPDMPGLGMPPEQLATVLALLGAEALEPQPQHPGLERCDVCDGWGLLATGSRREAYLERPCLKCNGNGFVDLAQERALEASRPPDGSSLFYEYPLPQPAAPSATQPGQIVQGGYAFFPAPGGAADPWGRIAGHPLWGREPTEGGI